MQQTTRQRPPQHKVQAKPFPAALAKPVQAAPAPESVNAEARCACGGACPRCQGGEIVQMQLTVGRPDDQYEQEADRVADWVTRLPEPPEIPGEESEQLVEQATPSPVGEAAPVQTKPLPISSLPRQRVNRKAPEDEDAVQAKTESGSSARVGGVEAQIDSLRSGGQPLPNSTRRFFESRMGYDFSGVRIHNDSHGAVASEALRARAFTFGRDVAFGHGQYAPHTLTGRHLLAHELTHVVQQGAAAPRIQRQPATPIRRRPDNRSVQRQEANPSEFLESGWREINDLGIVYQESGANLRKAPEGELITWLPQNTKVFILKHQPVRKWYAVTTMGSQSTRFGYIADWLVWRHLPDPDADVLKIKAGQYPLLIAAKHYLDRGFNVWGKDLRYVVNALVWVNQNAQHNASGESGIKKPENVSEPWFKAQATAGTYIWLPGPDHMNALYETVAEHGGGTGSLTADLWRKVKNFAHKIAYGLAFVGGLVHGFVKSLYDAIVGLGKVVIDVLVSIFTGDAISDAKRLWESISELSWEDLKRALGAGWEKWERKLSSSSPWVSGHAHGYLTGYGLRNC